MFAFTRQLANPLLGRCIKENTNYAPIQPATPVRLRLPLLSMCDSSRTLPTRYALQVMTLAATHSRQHLHSPALTTGFGYGGTTALTLASMSRLTILPFCCPHTVGPTHPPSGVWLSPRMMLRACQGSCLPSSCNVPTLLHPPTQASGSISREDVATMVLKALFSKKSDGKVGQDAEVCAQGVGSGSSGQGLWCFLTKQHAEKCGSLLLRWAALDAWSDSSSVLTHAVNNQHGRLNMPLSLDADFLTCIVTSSLIVSRSKSQHVWPFVHHCTFPAWV